VSRVWIAGTRSFAAEIADFARDAGLYPAGLLDPGGDASEDTLVEGLAVIPLADGPPEHSDLAIAGTGEDDRRPVVARLEEAGWQLRGLVHPAAHVASSANIAPTAIVGPGAVVGAQARIGEHCLLGRGALVGHHTSLGDFSTLGPGANVGGNSTLGEGALVGMGAAVRDHTEVGARARVAMGAVVVAAVAPGAEVRGLPAREPG
jgi:sugar O-acyltransferase (sialic acid O-acetyltransferase NeuD family)